RGQRRRGGQLARKPEDHLRRADARAKTGEDGGRRSLAPVWQTRPAWGPCFLAPVWQTRPAWGPCFGGSNARAMACGRNIHTKSRRQGVCHGSSPVHV